MDDDHKDILLSSTPGETALDILAAVSSIAPWVGGPVSAVLAGISLTRKFERVTGVLLEMAAQIKNLESDTSHKYVTSEDFQDLLEKTLRQAADERMEEKRKAYSTFLANAIRLSSQSYDEKLRILSTLEETQMAHICVLKALLQEPDYGIHNISGSISQTLEKRLPDIPKDRIADLAQQLTDMRLANLVSLNTMMTARGAEELRHTLTPFGHTFIQYILEEPS